MRAGFGFALALLGSMVAAACSSGSTSSDGAGSGTSAFVIRDTVYTRVSLSGDNKVLIHLANISGLCDLLTWTTKLPGRDYDMISFELEVLNDPITIGEKKLAQFSSDGGIVSPSAASVYYRGIRNCGKVFGSVGSGTLDLTTLDDAHAVGTYDVTLASGWPFDGQPAGEPGHTKGSFDAPLCDLMGKAGFISCN